MTKPVSTCIEAKKIGITKVFTKSGETVIIPLVEAPPLVPKKKSEIPWYIKHTKGRW